MPADLLVPAWAAIVGGAVLLYVLLDGFDLGIGLLLPLAADTAQRDTMVASVAPLWDGNETWLVMGSLGLFAAFPGAFAAALPALAGPVAVMVLGLVMRGVAFELRGRAGATGAARGAWSAVFTAGSALAALAQGVMLGAWIDGIPAGRAGQGAAPWAALSPFAWMCGAGLAAGYALLGSTWLLMKADGALRRRAQRWARVALLATGVAMLAMSLATPWGHEALRARWLGLLQPGAGAQRAVLLLPLAAAALGVLAGWRIGAARQRWLPHALVCGVFALAFAGLGWSLYPYVLPPQLSWQAAAAGPATLRFLLWGTLPILPLVLGYTVWTYAVFRGPVVAGGDPHDGGYAPLSPTGRAEGRATASAGLGAG